MNYGFRLEVWGDYALFTRPEMKAERVSYDVMTPSAARGILEAIFWHKGMRWIVDKIYVMSKIKFANIKRNEVGEKISCDKVHSGIKNHRAIYLATQKEVLQRASMVLKEPHYIIEAHFEMTDKGNPTDNEGKFCEIFRRRVSKGQCYHTPYLGCREMPAYFRLYGDKEIRTAYEGEDMELGFMLYDMDYSDLDNITPMFFRAKLQNGVLNLQDCEVYR